MQNAQPFNSDARIFTSSNKEGSSPLALIAFPRFVSA
jgi:hypothetical protein